MQLILRPSELHRVLSVSTSLRVHREHVYWFNFGRIFVGVERDIVAAHNRLDDNGDGGLTLLTVVDEPQLLTLGFVLSMRVTFAGYSCHS